MDIFSMLLLAALLCSLCDLAHMHEVKEKDSVAEIDTPSSL